MTTMLTSLIDAKNAERAELSELVEQFLAKQQVQEMPVVQRPLVSHTFRIQNNVMREAEDASRLKALADKHCRQQQSGEPSERPKRKVNVKSAHAVRSSLFEAERKRSAPLIAEMVAKGWPTSQICERLGKSRAFVERTAKEARLTLNRSPATRRKE